MIDNPSPLLGSIHNTTWEVSADRNCPVVVRAVVLRICNGVQKYGTLRPFWSAWENSENEWVRRVLSRLITLPRSTSVFRKSQLPSIKVQCLMNQHVHILWHRKFLITLHWFEHTLSLSSMWLLLRLSNTFQKKTWLKYLHDLRLIWVLPIPILRWRVLALRISLTGLRVVLTLKTTANVNNSIKIVKTHEILYNFKCSYLRLLIVVRRRGGHDSNGENEEIRVLKGSCEDE